MTSPNTSSPPASANSGPRDFFSRVRRTFSFRKKSGARRKSSQSSLNSLCLDNLFSEVNRKQSNSSKDSLRLHIENEELYCSLLRSVIHCLGSADTTIGLRPGDLADHLRLVFGIDRDDHEFFIREEVLNKPSFLKLNVTVVEAKDLKLPAEHQGWYDVYCLLSLSHPCRSNKGSPKTSPRVSPGSSPKARSAKGGSLEQASVLRTQTSRTVSEPKWNQAFELDVDDIFTDELWVYVCYHDKDNNGGSNGKSTDKTPSAFRNLFRHLRTALEHDKFPNDCCLGVVVVPLRDIPTVGMDDSLDILDGHHTGKNLAKSRIVGQCRLKISISVKQEEDLMDTYYQATLQMFKSAAKTASKGANSGVLEGLLPLQSQRILDIYAVSHHLSKLSQTLFQLIVLLEWSSGETSRLVSETALTKAVQQLQMTWLTMQVGQTSMSQKLPLTYAEIVLFRKAAASYIRFVIGKLKSSPSFFPPSIDNLNVLKCKVSILVQLLEVDLWESESTVQNELTDSVMNKLQEDVSQWLDKQLKSIDDHETVKDPIILELSALCEVISTTAFHCSPIGVIQHFFNSLGIIYYRWISLSLESKLSSKAQELMMQMDRYQLRYHNFAINITTSSQLSLRLYFALRKLCRVIKDNLTERDLFRLHIAQYQNWFEESLIYWLQTFKTECMSRMEKALEIDKDVVLVTSLVKYSNSSVDVLTSFAKITEEWRQIDIINADAALMGVTKITDIICDGARLYADKIHCILERNCYYDKENGHFDVTDRLCITLNNIEHVCQYLNELPHLLDWERVTKSVASKHDRDVVGRQALKTLQRLIKTAHGDILMKSTLVIQQITERMKVDIDQYIEIFTRKSPEKASSIDKIMAYLSSNLKTLQDRLMASIYPKMTEELCKAVLRCFDEQLLVGKHPDYYMQMKKHMRSLGQYFLQGGIDDEKVQCHFYHTLKNRVDMNCQTTDDLIMSYFNDLAGHMETPVDYYGHIALKTAYMEETRGNVTVFVKVIQASDLPGLDASGLSDPYVVVSLQPNTIFGFKSQRTRTVAKTLQPVFNTTFQFPNVPRQYLNSKGAVLLLTVLDHDNLTSDDFAGEVVIKLSSIPSIGIQKTVDSASVVLMPLKRPTLEHGPFRVLQERSSWDKTSKTFTTERLKYINNQPRRTDHSGSTKGRGLFTFFETLRKT